MGMLTKVLRVGLVGDGRRRASLFRSSECVPKSKYHLDGWFHHSAKSNNVFVITPTQIHLYTRAQKLCMYETLFSASIRCVGVSSKRHTASSSINVSLNDLRVAILFRFWRRWQWFRMFVASRWFSFVFISKSIYLGLLVSLLLGFSFFWFSFFFCYSCLRKNLFPSGLMFFICLLFIVIHCFGHRNRHAMNAFFQTGYSKRQ